MDVVGLRKMSVNSDGNPEGEGRDLVESLVPN